MQKASCSSASALQARAQDWVSSSASPGGSACGVPEGCAAARGRFGWAWPAAREVWGRGARERARRGASSGGDARFSASTRRGPGSPAGARAASRKPARLSAGGAGFRRRGSGQARGPVSAARDRRANSGSGCARGPGVSRAPGFRCGGGAAGESEAVSPGEARREQRKLGASTCRSPARPGHRLQQHQASAGGWL